ncbi:hypothetical protein [Kordiimonas sp.]|uniref:hypothetical protein n=1 Tax=Kordiimonas sp. TaxID=1970157 RepID=UPI003A955DA6
MKTRFGRFAVKTVVGAAAALLLAQAASAQNVVKCDFRAFKKLGPSGPAIVSGVRGAMTPIALNSVQIIDKNIAKKILPQGVFARRTDTGTLEVMARLINCTDYPQEVLVRTSFMDVDQFPAEPETAWQRVFLQPRSTSVYREMSISMDIGYYLIEVDEGE